MDASTFLGLLKPVGDDPFTRSTFTDNMDDIDKTAIALAFAAVAYGSGTVTKGAMVFDDNGYPLQQAISGPNGLTGSITWSFTATTITETLSITAPVAFSVTKMVTLSNLSETWTFS